MALQPQQQPSLGALAGQQSPIQVEQDDSPEAVAVRKQKWSAFFANAQVQAALLQFGVSALQPRAPGQTTGGALASAVGQGAQAATRVGAAQQAQAQQRTENIQAQERIRLQGRQVGAAETTAAAATRRAEIGATTAALAERRLDQQAEQFVARLRQDLGIAKNSSDDKTLAFLMKSESERAELEGRAPDFEAVRRQFESLQQIKSGKVTPSAISTETPAQLAKRFATYKTPEELAAATKRLLDLGVSQETIDAALALNVADVEEAITTAKEEEAGFESPNKLAFAKIEATMLKKGFPARRGKPQPLEEGLGPKEEASAQMQETFPEGLDSVSEEDFKLIAKSRRLQEAFNLAFISKSPGQTAFAELRSKFIKIKKPRRGRGAR